MTDKKKRWWCGCGNRYSEKRKVRGFAELRIWIRVAEPLVIVCNDIRFNVDYTDCSVRCTFTILHNSDSHGTCVTLHPHCGACHKVYSPLTCKHDVEKHF